MEPKFQTSFIPKTPVSASAAFPGKPKSLTISILPLIGNIIFALSILGYGALYGYGRLLSSQIAEADKALVLAKASFDTASTEQIIVASEQINSAKSLLNRHIAVSNIFSLLEANVLPDIRFTTFTFEGTNDLVNISVLGEASSYSSLAQQSNIFSKIDSMSNGSFSDFNLTDKGNVQLKFSADIKPDLISYSQTVEKTSPPNNTSTINP